VHNIIAIVTSCDSCHGTAT